MNPDRGMSPKRYQPTKPFRVNRTSNTAKQDLRSEATTINNQEEQYG